MLATLGRPAQLLLRGLLPAAAPAPRKVLPGRELLGARPCTGWAWGLHAGRGGTAAPRSGGESARAGPARVTGEQQRSWTRSRLGCRVAERTQRCHERRGLPLPPGSPLGVLCTAPQTGLEWLQPPHLALMAPATRLGACPEGGASVSLGSRRRVGGLGSDGIHLWWPCDLCPSAAPSVKGALCQCGVLNTGPRDVTVCGNGGVEGVIKCKWGHQGGPESNLCPCGHRDTRDVHAQRTRPARQGQRPWEKPTPDLGCPASRAVSSRCLWFKPRPRPWNPF